MNPLRVRRATSVSLNLGHCMKTPNKRIAAKVAINGTLSPDRPGILPSRNREVNNYSRPSGFKF